MAMYPLLMKPYFRYGEMTPWGGSALKEIFGKNAPDDRCGESLEISALKGMESVVENGEHAGKTLPEMIALWGEAMTGAVGDVFPLLLKILDAREMLSVQVHPGDEYASAHDGKLGKTEAWVILNCDEGAKIAYGLDTNGRDLAEIVAAGDIEKALHWEKVAPGEVYYIPHGMVHALGGGIQCYEIQQSSDATYRFWDWGRVGKDGKPRELHTKKALDVSRPDLHPGKIAGTTLLSEGGSRTYYICNENFELMRLNVAGKMPVDFGRMTFLTPMDDCVISWDGGEMALQPFTSVLVPAKMGRITIQGKLPVLCCAIPDQAALKDALGYRAENVAGLCE